jgi:hypothetical protein
VDERKYNVEQGVPTLRWVYLSTIDILKNIILNSGTPALERKLLKEFLVYVFFLFLTILLARSSKKPMLEENVSTSFTTPSAKFFFG